MNGISVNEYKAQMCSVLVMFSCEDYVSYQVVYVKESKSSH